MGFPHSSVGKESACNAGDPGTIPGLGRCPGKGIGYPLQYSWVSLVAQLVKNLPAMRETWVWSLGWEDPWKRERLPTPVFWPEEFHRLYSPWARKESGTLSNFHFYFPSNSIPICLCLHLFSFHVSTFLSWVQRPRMVALRPACNASCGAGVNRSWCCDPLPLEIW